MAGDGEDGRIYIILLFITVFMWLALIRRRNRFQQRLLLLTIRSNKYENNYVYYRKGHGQMYYIIGCKYVFYIPHVQ